MGSIEKLENPTIEFFEVTFLGLKPSNCGMTEEQFNAYVAEMGGDINKIHTLYGVLD